MSEDTEEQEFTAAEKATIEMIAVAFSMSMGGCREECACGAIYFADDERGFDWDEGEFERLHERAAEGSEQEDAVIACDFTPGRVHLGDAQTYVDACDCWHPRALQLANFLEKHGDAVSRYYDAAREAKMKAAREAVTLKRFRRLSNGDRCKLIKEVMWGGEDVPLQGHKAGQEVILLRPARNGFDWLVVPEYVGEDMRLDERYQFYAHATELEPV